MKYNHENINHQAFVEISKFEGQKGVWSRSRDLVLHFGIPLYLWNG